MNRVPTPLPTRGARAASQPLPPPLPPPCHSKWLGGITNAHLAQVASSVADAVRDLLASASAAVALARGGDWPQLRALATTKCQAASAAARVNSRAFMVISLRVAIA